VVLEQSLTNLHYAPAVWNVAKVVPPEFLINRVDRVLSSAELIASFAIFASVIELSTKLSIKIEFAGNTGI
jgi:hypothetical protein